MSYEKNKDKKTSNKKNFFLLTGVALVSVGVIYGGIKLHHRNDKHEAPKVQKQDALASIISSDYTDKDNQSQLLAQQNTIDDHESEIQRLKRKEKSNQNMSNSQINDLKQQIKDLKSRFNEFRNDQYNQGKNKSNDSNDPLHNDKKGKKKNTDATGIDPSAVPAGAQYVPPNMRIQNFGLNWAETDEQKLQEKHTFKNYVPTGSFVRAVMLGGADANAGVNGSADARPVLFRLLTRGTLPNGKHSKLKGCLAVGSVYGSISEERGIIRLESLSCTLTNGDILDTAVKGTAFGVYGKNGVRGIPVLKNGKIVYSAGIGGFISGIGKAASQMFTDQSISPLGETTSVKPQFALGYAGADGVSTAASKIADYYIKLAEQYHPIVQLDAGTQVDLVFLQGFSLDPDKAQAVHLGDSTVTKSKNPVSADDLLAHAKKIANDVSTPNGIQVEGAENAKKATQLL